MTFGINQHAPVTSFSSPPTGPQDQTPSYGTRLRDGKHHRTSHGDVIAEHAAHRGLVREGDVGDAAETLRNDATLLRSEGAEGGATGLEATSGEGASLGLGSAVGLEHDGGADGNSAGLSRGGHRQLGEGLESQVGTLRAGGDEGRGQGEDSTNAEGSIEGLGNGDLLGGGADEGLVASLDGEDRAGGTEDSLVLDEGSGSQVGGDTDVLEDGGGLDHAGGIGEAKVVLAGLNGLSAGLGNRRLQKRDVRQFGSADLLEVVNLLHRETQSHEVLCRELLEALLVESTLEPFQGKSAVKPVLVVVSHCSALVCPVIHRIPTHNWRMSISVNPAAPAPACCLLAKS